MKKKILNELLSAQSPSGNELNAIEVFKKHTCDAYDKINLEFVDAVNNCATSIGSGVTTIMLSGHIDEIGLQVQTIDDNGFIHFIKDGGIDPKVLLGSTVSIMPSYGKEPIMGIIGKKPIHVEYRADDEKDKVTKIKDMKIDVGCSSKEEVLALGIEIGDYITIEDIRNLSFGANRMVSRGLDDKIGVLVTMLVMRELAERNSPLQNVKVFGVACTQEEVSGSGAVGAATKIDPNISIDYDVTFATDDDYVSPNEYGDVKLGNGGAIAHGVDSNPRLAKLVRNVAKKHYIPYQEFSVGSGGTNTVEIKQSSTDCNTLLLSIPQRNMHTQVEVCDWRDIDSLVKMTVETILTIENNGGRIPEA